MFVCDFDFIFLLTHDENLFADDCVTFAHCWWWVAGLLWSSPLCRAVFSEMKLQFADINRGQGGVKQSTRLRRACL